jgi:uncharacterized protein YuzB (UPF0349 family)
MGLYVSICYSRFSQGSRSLIELKLELDVVEYRCSLDVDEYLCSFPMASKVALLSRANGEGISGVTERESFTGRFGFELVESFFRRPDTEPQLGLRVTGWSSSIVGVWLLEELMDDRRTLLPRRLRSET